MTKEQVIAALALLRRQKGVKQKELAEYVGVATPTLISWEYCKTYPTLAQLEKICEYLGQTFKIETI
jgi:DNA-binding helix-turn-helix protein